MMRSYGRGLSLGIQAIVSREVTSYSRGWELRQISRILVLAVVTTLSLAGASSARQAKSDSSTQQQQSTTCPMHQSQQSVSCPMHQQHKAEPGNPSDQANQQNQEGARVNQRETGHHHDHDAMNQRGNTGMGFDQEKTTHHFRLLPQGGAIEVVSNDAADTASRDQIRAHLVHIAGMFTAGDFSIPMFVHDQTPPGVDTMKRLSQAITYEYEEMENGGRVKISTSDPQALEAIHVFLRFQIREHQTGDPFETGRPRGIL